MGKSKYLFILCLAICSFGAPLHGKELVEEFTGSRSGHTGVFEVEAPWLLDWRVNSDFSNSPTVDVSLVEANTGIHVGSVLKTQYVSNGVRLFNEGGRFQFKIDASMARWTLRVEQLTEKEAELYKPKR